jgi:hypothetical protein
VIVFGFSWKPHPGIRNQICKTSRGEEKRTRKWRKSINSALKRGVWGAFLPGSLGGSIVPELPQVKKKEAGTFVYC